MRLLVLGGSAFIGRAVVDEGLVRGWAVTTFNRGLAPHGGGDVERLVGDRLEPGDLATAVGDRTWDLVVDTWAGAPWAVRDSASALEQRTARYVYVSTASVYAYPLAFGVDEAAPVVAASADADRTGYAEDKRGGELAVEAVFGDRALFARCGLVIGPHEDVGRLPWWLLRMARGGEVLAPGPADLGIQGIDARDLATFLLDAGATPGGPSGPVITASPPAHTTTGALLAACRAVTGSDATLTWVPPEHVLAAGIAPWTELPTWLPPEGESRGLMEMETSAARAAGLRCRPIEETVADTWAWLERIGRVPRLRTDLPPRGLPADREQAALAAWHASAGT